MVRVGFSSKLQLPKVPRKLQNYHFLVDKLGPFVVTDYFIFSSSSLFNFFSRHIFFLFSHLFFAHHFEFSLLCTLKWCGSDFSSKLQVPKILGIHFWLTNWVPSWGEICLVFSLTFLPVTLNLAFFAPLNSAGRIVPVNFNYQRCLENSKIINFWLTSWVTLW